VFPPHTRTTVGDFSLASPTLVAQDAIKRKAQRENERATEARRRLRLREEAEKQRLLAQLEADERRVRQREEASEKREAEKRAKREALKEAFFASRMSMAHAAQIKANEWQERNGQAEAKRNKLLQATVHKSAWEVKHAIAVAAAAKEKELEAKTSARTSLQERLAAAEERRNEGVPGLTLKASPPSPTRSAEGSNARFGRPSSRARLVAQCLNDEAVALEMKRQRLSQAMEKALVRRAAKIEARVLQAAKYKEKALAAFENRRHTSSSEDAAKGLRRQQAAEVRAALHLCSRAGRMQGSFAFDIALEKSDAKPAPALLARLNAKPVALAASAAARHELATARVAKIREAKLSKQAARAKRVEAAAAARALRIRVCRAKMEARAAASAASAASALTDRVAKAKMMNKHVLSVAAKRVAARHTHLARLETNVGLRAAADKRRLARLYKQPHGVARALLFTASRAAADRATAERGVQAKARVDAASSRRVQHLASRIAKAKLASIRRDVAVKLTTKGAAISEMPVVQVEKAEEKAEAEELAGSVVKSIIQHVAKLLAPAKA